MSSVALPPFLEKLRAIAKNTPAEVAGWSDDGKVFMIHNNRFEKEILGVHFRGSRQTFIRQLHFYCFKKLDNKGEAWAFFHPKFHRDSPHLIYEIKRKTRTENGGPASKVEVQSIRVEMDDLRKKMQSEIGHLKRQLDVVLQKISKNNKCGCRCSEKSGRPREETEKNSRVGAPMNKRRKTKSSIMLSVEYPDDADATFLPQPFEESSFDLFGDDLLDATRSSLYLSMQDEELSDQLVRSLSDDDMFLAVGLSSVTGARFFEDVAKDSFMLDDEKSIQVVLCDRNSESIEFGARAFAGFLLKFVEKARLLSCQNLLHNFDAVQDKQLMSSVLSRFSESCPLRELSEVASPYVRRVLLHVLKEVPEWSEVSSKGIKCEKTSPLKDRAFMIFQVSKSKTRDITGQRLLTFLSFLLDASLMPGDVVSKSQASQATPNPNLLGMFANYFEPEMKGLLAIAHRNLAQMKTTSVD